MNDSEAIAKRIIESLLPGTTMHYKPDQNVSTYDFDLVYPNNNSVPVEVTVSTDETARGIAAAVRNPRKGGYFIPRKRCQKDWYLSPCSDAVINRIREQVDAYLVNIESEGFDQFFAYTDAVKSPAVERIFKDLRVEAGQVFKWKQPGYIGLALPGYEAVLDASYVERAVKVEASKDDNRNKLGQINAPERHLFVYIDHYNFPAWYAINESTPPYKMPVLPSEITHIWVAAATRIHAQYVVWKGSSATHWTREDIFLLTEDQT